MLKSGEEGVYWGVARRGVGLGEENFLQDYANQSSEGGELQEGCQKQILR